MRDISITRIQILLLLAVLMTVPLLSTISEAKGPKIQSLTVFKDDMPDTVLTFHQPGTQSVGISLDIVAEVHNGTVTATPGPLDPNTADFPTDPTIDIRTDGVIDWGFSGTGYGMWGLQDGFYNGSKQFNLTYEAGQSYQTGFKLPMDAEIINGSLSVRGTPRPILGLETMVSRPDSESRWEYGPVFAVFKGKLFMAWESKDPMVTDGDDSDIVYRWFDGTNWSQYMEITLPGDALEDDYPYLTVYQDKLYCAWAAAETGEYYSNSDLLLRWTADGENWEPVMKVSPEARGGWSDWPIMEIFDGRLYIFWKTMDPSIAEVSSDDDHDIVCRYWDGTDFGSIVEITKGDDGATDWTFDLEVYRDNLYVVWSSMPAKWGDYDIYYRSFDGNKWWGRTSLSPSHDYLEDDYPRFKVWYNPVKGIEELFMVWSRGYYEGDGEGDTDIVYKTFDGDAWSSMGTISIEKAMNLDPTPIVYKGRLYVSWLEGVEVILTSTFGTLSTYELFGNVMVRFYNGTDWGPVLELTSEAQDDLATDPIIHVYEEKIYGSWSYPKEDTPHADDWEIALRVMELPPVTLEVDIGVDGGVDWSGVLPEDANGVTIPLDEDRIEEAVYNSKQGEVDDFGNEMIVAQMAIKSIYPATIEVSDLRIEHENPIRFDITDQFNLFLDGKRAEREGENSTEDPRDVILVNFTIEASSGSTGKIILKDLEIGYSADHPPFLMEAIPVLVMQEDTDLPDAIDLEVHFGDDWDDGILDFKIVWKEDPTLVEASLAGGWLGLRTPTENWYGTSNITVVAVDSSGLDSKSCNITVEVLPVNDLPVITSTPINNTTVGRSYEYDVNARDVDRGDFLTFSLAEGPEGMRINHSSGRILWASGPGQEGEHVVVIEVTDSDATVNQTYNLTVHLKIEPPPDTTSSTYGECLLFGLLLLLLFAMALIFMARGISKEEGDQDGVVDQVKRGRGERRGVKEQVVRKRKAKRGRGKRRTKE